MGESVPVGEASKQSREAKEPAALFLKPTELWDKALDMATVSA